MYPVKLHFLLCFAMWRRR